MKSEKEAHHITAERVIITGNRLKLIGSLVYLRRLAGKYDLATPMREIIKSESGFTEHSDN